MSVRLSTDQLNLLTEDELNSPICYIRAYGTRSRIYQIYQKEKNL